MQTDDRTDSICHYGVLGMRWGIRKDKSSAFASDSLRGNTLKLKQAKANYAYKKRVAKEYSRMPDASEDDDSSAFKLSRRAQRLGNKAQKANQAVDSFTNSMHRAYKNVSINEISDAAKLIGSDYVSLLSTKNVSSIKKANHAGKSDK